MAFAWRSFIDIADELAARDDEAAGRTAVSRAYYAVLGVSLDALPSAERTTIHPGNLHDRTWELYAPSSTVACRRIGNLGLRLRNHRRIADYRASHPVVERDARQAVADAHQLLTLLDQHGYQP